MMQPLPCGSSRLALADSASLRAALLSGGRRPLPPGRCCGFRRREGEGGLGEREIDARENFDNSRGNDRNEALRDDDDD